MTEFEFNKWPKTKRFTDAEMIITQKMDGTNAQILFHKESTHDNIMVMAGSRNKWLIDGDNFGFKAFVQENVHELFLILGRGRHYGEWCGPGIQTSEGLSEKKLFLFDSRLEIPDNSRHLIDTVPVLYRGPVSLKAIHTYLKLLCTEGSFVNGFHTPEGLIVSIAGVRYKVYTDQLATVENMLYQQSI